VFAHCKAERERFCKSVPPGRARVLMCLQDHLQDAAMSAECRSQVEKQEARSVQDVRAMPDIVVRCSRHSPGLPVRAKVG
jgi:hypothetical protein